jgi:hypothetical protein
MKLKLFNIQFSKISIFHLKKNPLLAANRFYWVPQNSRNNSMGQGQLMLENML